MDDLTDQTFSERVLEGFESRGDVILFVGGPGQEELIKASAFVLSISSPVFDAMFNPHWKEQKQVAKLPEIQPQIFKHFLKLLVTERLDESHIEALNLTVHEVFELLNIAKKFDVNFVYSVCILFLKAEITRNFSATGLIYEFARKCNHVDLEYAAFAVIAKNAAQVIRTEEFVQLSRETLAQLLRSNDLVIKETTLFLHLVRWAEAKCALDDLEMTGENLRKVIGKLLGLIRFPLLTSQEVFMFVRPTQILTDREILDLLEYIVLPTPQRSAKISFGNSPRSYANPLEQGEGSGPQAAKRKRTP